MLMTGKIDTSEQDDYQTACVIAPMVFKTKV